LLAPTDASVADECANFSVATPTAAGEFCVALLENAERLVADAATAVVLAARDCLDAAEEELDRLESTVATRAAAVTTTAAAAALARSRRVARLAVVVVIALAAAVMWLLWLR
jgi:exonuclease VII large subunit